MRTFLPLVVTGLLSACGTLPTNPPIPENSILNLYDAFGPKRPGTIQAFGFSALIRYQDKTILFDAGSDAEILRQNAAALGVDLREVDIAIGSHTHFDHLSGFDYLLSIHPKVQLYLPADGFYGADMPFSVAGPESGAGRGLDEDQRYFGGRREEFVFRQSGRFWRAKVEYVADHKEIAPGLTLIATRSPFVGYFTRYPSLGGLELEDAGNGVKTIPLPELSLNLSHPAGDVLVVGCSHSLVERIVAATRKHLGRKVGLVYGGFHLLPYPAQTVLKMARRMRDEHGIAEVAPAHCTGHIGFRVFRHVFGSTYHKAGLGTLTHFPD